MRIMPTLWPSWARAARTAVVVDPDGSRGAESLRHAPGADRSRVADAQPVREWPRTHRRRRRRRGADGVVAEAGPAPARGRRVRADPEGCHARSALQLRGADVSGEGLSPVLGDGAEAADIR